MQPSSSLRRQLSSVPKTHRQQTLTAIAANLHALNQRIVLSRHGVDRFHRLMEDAPLDGSRLAWIQSQLNQTGV